MRHTFNEKDVAITVETVTQLREAQHKLALAKGLAQELADLLKVTKPEDASNARIVLLVKQLKKHYETLSIVSSETKKAQAIYSDVVKKLNLILGES